MYVPPIYYLCVIQYIVIEIKVPTPSFHIYTKMGAIGVLSSFFMSLTVQSVYSLYVTVKFARIKLNVQLCCYEHIILHTNKTGLEFY